jgi:hypothetical protein
MVMMAMDPDDMIPSSLCFDNNKNVVDPNTEQR